MAAAITDLQCPASLLIGADDEEPYASELTVQQAAPPVPYLTTRVVSMLSA